MLVSEAHIEQRFEMMAPKLQTCSTLVLLWNAQNMDT